MQRSTVGISLPLAYPCRTSLSLALSALLNLHALQSSPSLEREKARCTAARCHAQPSPAATTSTGTSGVHRTTYQHPLQKNNALANPGPRVRGWGRAGGGPVASRCTLAAEFTSQTQGALSERPGAKFVLCLNSNFCLPR